MTSLSALTAPFNMHHAISCTVHLTHIQCDPVLDQRPFDFNLDGSFIFVPAFSVGPISVGFGVQECSTNCSADWCLPLEHDPPFGNANHFRFVRDDSNGVLLLSRRDRHTGCIKMETISHISVSSRRRVVAVFDHDALQKAVHAAHGILPADAVLDALTVINFLTESRDCPQCGAMAASPCTCIVETTLPAHPLDFSSIATNMSTYLGSWEGLALSALVSKGIDYLKANVGCTMQVLEGNDQDLLGRLSRWAISDQLNSKKENPMALVMPNEDLQAGSNETSSGNVDVDSADWWLNESDYEPLDIVPPLLDDDLNASSCSSGSGGMILDGGKRGTGILTVSKLDNAVSSRDMHEEDSDLEQGRVDENMTERVKLSETADEALALINRITKMTNDDDMGDVDAADEDSLESLSKVAVFKIEDSKSRTDAVGETHVSKTLAIAPAAVTNSSVAIQEQDEKELRAQRRKQRNREAAQRSNARRKLKNDTLKQALKETHERAAQLRALELSLREENLRLRKLTSS